MKLLVFDADSIDRSLLRSHLEPRFGPHLEIIDARSRNDILSAREGQASIDAVLLGRPGHPGPLSGWIRSVAQDLPEVPLVVVHPKDEIPQRGQLPEDVLAAFLPEHQLALLPARIQQLAAPGLIAPSVVSDELTNIDLSMDPYRIIASQPSDFVYYVDYEPDGSIRNRHRSQGVFRLTGFDESEASDWSLSALVHPDDIDTINERVRRLMGGQSSVDEYRLRTKSGRICWVRDYARPILSEDGSFVARIVGAGLDISAQKLAQERLAGQASVLGLIAQGERTGTVLEALISVVEDQIPDARCSILLVEETGRFLRHKAASRLPLEFVDMLGEVPIAADGGACGNAALNDQLTICHDIHSDPRCQKFREVVGRWGVRSVWSNPIHGGVGRVVGTFATYYDSVRDPQDFEITLLEVAAQLAGIALDKEQRESELLVAESRYRTLVEQTPLITFTAEPDNHFDLLYVSPQISTYFALTPEQALNDPERVLAHIEPEDRKRVAKTLVRSIETGEDLEIEFRVRGIAGRVDWIQCKAVLVRDKDGSPSHWQGVMLDVTERNQAMRKLEDSEQRYRSLFQDNLNAVFTYDMDGKILALNPAAERISGYTQSELIGQDFYSILAPDQIELARAHMSEALLGKPQQHDIAIIGKLGNRIDLHISKSPLMVDGEIVGVSGIAEDVTERNRLEAELVCQAYHDPLTGLPNRTYFFEHLAGSFAALGPEMQIAVLFLDLNNFKVINDSLGHDVGDQFLISIADVLRSVLPDGAVVARLGGDEFTIILTNQTDATESARLVASELMSVLSGPLQVSGYELGTNVSIGIAVSSGGPDDMPKDLVRRADVALYEAKQSGHDSRYAIFNPGMDEWVFERLWIERDLRQAVETDQIEVCYQPLVDLETDRVTAVEALLRWQHPTRGLLSPGRFLRVAEETGYVIDLDSQVLRTACRQVVDWNLSRQDGPPLHLGVNISAREFWHAGFVERILGMLRETEFDPHLLRIEITESTMMQDVALASSLVEELRGHGVQFAIDDFGTGYSSLSYLRQFPVDALKIDRSFVQSLEDDVEQQGIVRAIVSMARAMNLTVVAEGVETPGQYHLAKVLGCDLAQGFYIAHPQPFDCLSATLLEQAIGQPAH